MYYELLDKRSAYPDPAKIGEYPELPDDVSFNMGERIAAPIATPLRFELDPDWGRDIAVFTGSQVPVMRKDLIQALRAAGVDNIDAYDAVIVDPRDQKEVHDYQAVNIVGLVSAANLAASDFESFGETPKVDALFGRPVIDEKRAAGALLFRMQESVMTVMVHDRVKNQIAPRFPTLQFNPAGPSERRSDLAPATDDEE
jgi:rhodanese-related sulfurtransferase